MTYYIFVKDNKINGCGQCECSNMTSIEVSEEVYNNYISDNDLYIYQDGEIVANPDYGKIKEQERETEFKKEFFLTSLGWIRRKPTLADGSQDDFLNNDLPLLAIGLMSGSNPILPIAYQQPDFTQELTPEYMISLQVKNQPITQQFLNECMAVKMSDFIG